MVVNCRLQLFVARTSELDMSMSCLMKGAQSVRRGKERIALVYHPYCYKLIYNRTSNSACHSSLVIWGVHYFVIIFQPAVSTTVSFKGYAAEVRVFVEDEKEKTKLNYTLQTLNASRASAPFVCRSSKLCIIFRKHGRLDHRISYVDRSLTIRISTVEFSRDREITNMNNVRW